jgi:hypothetical protein
MSDNSREILLAKVLSKMSHLRRTAWKPIVKFGEDNCSYTSKFGGVPCLQTGENWPTCSKCKNPMRFFFQIDSQDFYRHENCLFGDGILQFFFCSSIRCQEQSTYGSSSPFNPRQLVRVLDRNHLNYRVDLPEMSGPFPNGWRVNNYFFSPSIIIGWKPNNDYPNFIERAWIGFDFNNYDDDFEKDDDEEYNMAHELCYPKFKLFGWPDWSNSRESPKCPICEGDMNFLLQLPSNDCLPYSWDAEDNGYIFHCPHHLEQITFIWGA